MKWRLIALTFTLTSLLTTGCWDRQELNERAFILATGVDLAKDGSIIESIQYAVPSQLGGPEKGTGDGKAFNYAEAKGRDIEEARQKLQAKVSRQIFAGHRRAIYIGENLAKHGVWEVLDIFSRYPEIRMRTDMFVVKGGEAREELKLPYPFERIPAIASLKIHKEIGGHPGDTSFRDFLVDASSDSSCPTLLSMSGNKVTGRALFDRDLKLVGYLIKDEAAQRLWLVGGVKHYIFTTYIPQGKGFVSINMTGFHAQVIPVFRGNRPEIHLVMKAEGNMTENETTLDMMDAKNVELVKKQFEETQKQQFLNMIHKVQSQYKTDVFRFGEAVHRKYPYRWKAMKSHWQDIFSTVPVEVTVRLKIERTGLTGKSLQLPSDEEKQT